MIKKFSKIRLDRVESIYLSILRTGVLAVATLCLLAAAWFAFDGLWRLAVPSEVKTDPTVVSAAEITAALRATEPADRSNAGPEIPDWVRAAHESFSKDVFPGYYAIYKRAFDANRKPDDKLETPSQLMEGLGYDLASYAAGESVAVKRFVEDEDYQRQALEAVGAAMNSPQALALFRAYKAAEKSEQRCVTVDQVRRVNQVCGYYYVYDCSYTQRVPVQRCEAVYPNGIVSPIQAFERADLAFAEAWSRTTNRNRATADHKRSERMATRALIGPRLILALQIAGAFLVVMFFFLVVAIERHLRGAVQARAQSVTDTESPEKE